MTSLAKIPQLLANHDDQGIEKIIENTGQKTLRAIDAINRKQQMHEQATPTQEDQVSYKTQQLLGTLDEQVNQINPSRWSFELAWWQRWLRWLFPDLPTPYQRWLKQFTQSSDHLHACIQSLRAHRQYLQTDWQRMQQLQNLIEPLLNALNHHIQALQDTDPKLSHSPLQFTLRQKTLDLQQIHAVNQQAFLSMQVIMQTHEQLIRAVDLAMHVTISALGTAAKLAQAEKHQSNTLVILSQLQAQQGSSGMPTDLAGTQAAFATLKSTLDSELKTLS